MIAELTADGPPDAWRDDAQRLVDEHGAVRIRGLELPDSASAGALLTALGGAPLDDTEAFAQRRLITDGVYTSATWPDHEPMCMHHELSYRRVVPGTVRLACTVAPQAGGATGTADAAAVLAALPADLVARFEQDGWLLVRNLGGDIGPSVAEAFGTDDRGTVEAYCAANGIGVEWLADGVLRTRQRRPAVITHPRTGRRVWFNQIAFLSEWTMDEEVRDFLVEDNGEDALPFRTCFGDGAAVGPEIIATINGTYDALTDAQPWRSGDLLVLDNLAIAHDREPFTGPREIVVGLADPLRVDALAAAS